MHTLIHQHSTVATYALMQRKHQCMKGGAFNRKQGVKTLLHLLR